MGHMRVLLVAAEAAPWAKTGGLGDVVGALPRHLHRLGVEVALALPKYRGLAGKPRVELRFPWLGKTVRAPVGQSTLPDSSVPVYLVEYPPYFDRAGIYGEQGRDYPDNLARFAFFSQAAVHLGSALGWPPHILHAHDWHTALVPVMAKIISLPVKTVLTVHNMAYAGWFPPEDWEKLAFPPEVWELVRGDGWGCALLGGLRAADFVTTVSPSYAEEILGEDHVLAEALRARTGTFAGILNGVDCTTWDPAQDGYLAEPWRKYTPGDVEAKRWNKRLLQRELGLVEEEGPLVGMVARLVEQKGVELVVEAFDRLMALGIELVILGTGEPRFESALQEAVLRHPGRATVLLVHSEAWAHRLIAGADVLLVPSRFEPCGLTQLYALRYGTVPIVRSTGGLKDTVRDCAGTTAGNGFVFAEYTSEALLEAVSRAVRMYRTDPGAWQRVVLRGAAEDHCWDRAARAYKELYHRLLGEPVAQ